jgi:predicted ABC-type ATPase
VIAGPPGVGKSMNGEEFIDSEFDIINEDEMRFKYKEQGYPDYQQQAVFRVRDKVKKHILANEDFAYELNLGYQDQYDYIVSAKTFHWDNRLNVTLFFTDSLQLCLDRAKKRHENGLHLVPPGTVTKMYNNTIPLLKTNFAAIDNLRLINANKANQFSIVAKYSKENKELNIRDSSPDWFAKDLKPFIDQYILDLKADQAFLQSLKLKSGTEENRDYDGPEQDAGYTGPER